MVLQETPASLAAFTARSNTLVACSLRSSAYFVSASRNGGPLLISESGSTTKITDTLAPRDFASAIPCATPCSAGSDPSVGMRICRYMLHLRLSGLHPKERPRRQWRKAPLTLVLAIRLEASLVFLGTAW